MGCVVNGPGEAREADIGIAGGNGEGTFSRRDRYSEKCPKIGSLRNLKKK